MNTFPRIVQFTVAAILCISAVSVPLAHGHVPDAKRLLQLLSNKLGMVDTLEVVQNLHIASTGDRDVRVDLSETVRYRFPESYRSDITGKDIWRIFLEKEDRLLIVTDGRISSGVKTWFDRYRDLLCPRSAPLLQDLLNEWGVDTSITSLGRINGTPVYVLGAQYPDKTSSQLWIDKNSLLPMRWLVADTGGFSSDIFGEIHYLKWGKSGDIWYPMVVRFFQNDRLVREICVKQVKSGEPIEEKWFDIEKLHDRYASSETILPSVHTIEEVQRAIREFTARFK